MCFSRNCRASSIGVLLIGFCSQVVALRWEDCRNTITYELGNHTIFINDTSIFHPDSTVLAPQLTLPACKAYCGAGRTWYPDIGPILNTWLIPVMILITQMDVSPLDKRTYLAILHLLGDPIDSMYCLLLKVESWSRCRLLAEQWERDHPIANSVEQMQEEAAIPRREGLRQWLVYRWRRFRGWNYSELSLGRRSSSQSPTQIEYIKTLGTVLGGIEDLMIEGANPLDVYTAISSPAADLDGFRIGVANELAKNRTDDLYRTCLAVALYFYQIMSAFITNLGGSASSPPGGRIGISMFLTWVLPAILLSNFLGNFPSAYTCYTIIQKRLPQENLLPLIDRTGIYHESTTLYFECRPWLGGIYTFRPEKSLHNDGIHGSHSRKLLFFLAALPVIISTVVGMTIIWHLPPAGPNCRWFVLLGISIAYFASAFGTWLIGVCGAKGRLGWRLTLTKDVFVAIPSLFLLFASSSGLFNTCWCWSGIILRKEKEARIGLNTEVSFKVYLSALYPGLFGTCLGLQLAVFGYMCWNGWKGLTLMRWSRERMATNIQGPAAIMEQGVAPDDEN